MNKAFNEILERLDKRCNVTVVSKEEKLPFSNVIANPLITEKDYNTNITIKEAKQIVQEVAEEYNNGWIPVKIRPMTEEEKEYYSEYLVDGNGMIYDCPLPDDGQEVLITSKFGSVDKTTFYTDCGNYFENYEDYDDVLAWQPLPEPYKEGK